MKFKRLKIREENGLMLIITIVTNLFIGIMSFASWLSMAVFTDGSGMLSAASFASLKFFTVLSNLLNGAAALSYVWQLACKHRVTVNMYRLKLAAVSAVGVTFLTVVVFLGPVFGYGSMFQGSNFWMHLVLPVISFLDFIFGERGYTLSGREMLWVTVPTLLYEIGYLLNIALHGIGAGPDANDFYGFLTWGAGVGAVIAAGMLLLTWGIALILQRLQRHKYITE